MDWWPWRFPSLRGDPIKSEVAIPSLSLFAWTKAHRAMVIMVDANLRDRCSRDPRARYEFELLADEPIQASLYADAGPDTVAVEATDIETGIRAFRGWAVIRDGPNDRLRTVSWFSGGIPNVRNVVWDQNCFTRIVDAAPPDTYFLRGNAERRQLADANAMLTAPAIRADLYITDRELPLSLEPDPWSRVTAVPLDIALPIIGLYLRRQHRFVLARTPALGAPEHRFDELARDRNFFYWEAAELVLVDAWRWNTACEAHARSTDDNTLRLLKTAVRHRMAQVLQSRDRLLAVTSVSQNILIHRRMD